MPSSTANRPGSGVGLAHLEPMLAARGVKVPADEFQRIVNLVFHSFESGVYDSVHRDMKESLPRVFNALANDWLKTETVPAALRVLDVGCGTGLSSELLLKTALGPRIQEMHFLDTSAEMMEKCQGRAALKDIRKQCTIGTLDELPADARYDLILVCSVLHHIPDLSEFLAAAGRLQEAGSAFLHLQDPNGDYLDDEALCARKSRLEQSAARRFQPLAKRLRPGRFVKKAQQLVTGQREKDYIELVNDELLRRGAMREPLTEMELWQVTDVHVFDGQGVSIRRMREWLKGYELVSARSYSFFGEMVSELPAKLRVEDDELFEQKAPNGEHIAAIWRK